MPKDNITKFPGDFRPGPTEWNNEVVGFADWRRRMARGPTEIRERILLAACAGLISHSHHRRQPIRCCGAKGCRATMPKHAAFTADQGSAFAVHTVDGLPESVGYLCPSHATGGTERDHRRVFYLQEVGALQMVRLIARDRGAFTSLGILDLLKDIGD